MLTTITRLCRWLLILLLTTLVGVALFACVLLLDQGLQLLAFFR